MGGTTLAPQARLFNPTPTPPAIEKDPQRVAALLTGEQAWILPQPKEVGLTGKGFKLRRAAGIRFVGTSTPQIEAMLADFMTMLKTRSGVELTITQNNKRAGQIVLGLFPDGKLPQAFRGIQPDELKNLGEQGYVLHVDKRGVSAAATGTEGLRYAMRTLAQLATDATVVPGLHLRDWPSMQYRGAMQDICRGQVPTTEALKRLADTLAEAKMNVEELYIEHTFKFKSHPQSSPPEGLTPAEARELFDYAARRGVEVHPLFQVLGHAGMVLKNPEYMHMAVRDNWPAHMTYDIRKPETVAFVLGMVKELQEAIPAKVFAIDVTEIDAEGFNKSGTPTEEIGRMMFDYILQIRKVLQPYGARLMFIQCSLGAEGAMGGLGAYLDKLPKDVLIGSYYTTVLSKTYDKDFPRLQQLGLDYCTNPWIYAHNTLMPWMVPAADFSDSEISKGLAYGSKGSITSDWGDEGHFHLVGQEYYPFLYHGASAWCGARLDRAYFDQAFCHLLYGVKDDGVARALKLATKLYEQKTVDELDETGKIVKKDPSEPHSNYFMWSCFNDPWQKPIPSSLADPGTVGRMILAGADPAMELLQTATRQATRNRDNLEQLVHGVRNYQAMGRKLVMLAHDRDAQYPPTQLKQELTSLVELYEAQKADFQRLWLAEDRENEQFHKMVGWYDQTINACRRKLAELESQAKK